MLPPGNSGLQVHRSTSVMLDAGMRQSWLVSVPMPAHAQTDDSPERRATLFTATGGSEKTG